MLSSRSEPKITIVRLGLESEISQVLLLDTNIIMNYLNSSVLLIIMPYTTNKIQSEYLIMLNLMISISISNKLI